MQVRHWGQLLGEAKEYVLDDTVRIPTGFATIDTLLRGGLRPGHLALMLGRTGVGKTAVTTQMVVNAVTQGWTVAYASLEMSRHEMAIRAISAHTHTSVEEAEALLVKGEDPRLADLAGLIIDDTTKPQWADLDAWVAELEAEGKRPALVVVDHMKLMGRYGYPRGEAERVSQLAEDSKAFAKRNNVALVMVHQVGRSLEGSDKKNHGQQPLTMESAMYGGEQDADSVFGVYRPALDPELSPSERQALDRDVYVQLVKNRHGEQHLDGVYVKWHKPSFWFEESTKEPDYF